MDKYEYIPYVEIDHPCASDWRWKRMHMSNNKEQYYCEVCKMIVMLRETEMDDIISTDWYVLKEID